MKGKSCPTTMCQTHGCEAAASNRLPQGPVCDDCYSVHQALQQLAEADANLEVWLPMLPLLVEREGSAPSIPTCS